jgi:hypothetical protein
MSKNENTLRLHKKYDIINETLNELLISLLILKYFLFSFVSQ